MMASFFQMNTASTLVSGSLPSNTIVNPKGELKAITTQSGIVLDGPFIPIPPPFINVEEDERVDETLMDQDLTEYTIKVPPPLEKLQELANTPLNENCLAVVLKKLPEKLREPGKFLIPCGFNELKCKDLDDLGASINLMPFSIWKKLGLPEFISTRMTLELANRAICTPAGIARDVFVSPSGNPTFPSHPEITSPKGKDDIFDPEGGNVLPEKLLDLDSTKDLHPPLYVNPLSGRTTYSSSPNQLLEEFADELALITFPPGNDDLQYDIKFDLKEIEYLLHHDSIKDIDSILKDSIDQRNLADLNDNLVNSMPEMFTDEHALDYSSPPLYDEYDDDIFEVESETKNVYDDPFESKGEKIKEYKLLIDELDLPSDFLPSSEYDSFLSEDFSKVDVFPSTNNEDKLGISHASLMIEDFDPPLYELPFFKEVHMSKILLPFSSKNKEKVFKPGIHTSEKVHSSLIPELSHQGNKVFKINQILKAH
nr:reverse transcriptase domain-containing protein [Tanacetum cinerariifolium]